MATIWRQENRETQNSYFQMHLEPSI